MPPTARAATPLVVLNPHASRLHDPETRARADARRSSGPSDPHGQTPVVADGHGRGRPRPPSRMPPARRPPLVVVAGGDGSVRQAAAALAGTGDPARDRPVRDRQRPRQRPAPGGSGGDGPAPSRRRSSGRRGSRPGHVGHRTGDPTEGEETFVVACGMGLDARIMAGTDSPPEAPLQLRGLRRLRVRADRPPRPSRFRDRGGRGVTELTGLAVLIANAGELIPGLLGPRQADRCRRRPARGPRPGRTERARGRPRRPRTAAPDGRAAWRRRPPPFGRRTSASRPTGPADPDRRRRPRTGLAGRPDRARRADGARAGRGLIRPETACYPAAMDEVPPPLSATGARVRAAGRSWSSRCWGSAGSSSRSSSS